MHLISALTSRTNSMLGSETAKLSLVLLVFLAVFHVPPRPRPQREISSPQTFVVSLSFNHWLDIYSFLKLFIIFCSGIPLLFHLVVLLSVRFITFDTNFCILRRHTCGSLRYLSSWISVSHLGITTLLSSGKQKNFLLFCRLLQSI